MRTLVCECGACKRCKHREHSRLWYQRKTAEERRAVVLARDPEKVRANDRARYYRDPESHKQRMKQWAADNPEKTREIKVAWAKRNPEKRKAHWAVGNAVRDGKLQRGPCETCGAERTEAHHDDYSKPLDVRWLCRTCHSAEHRTY